MGREGKKEERAEEEEERKEGEEEAESASALNVHSSRMCTCCIPWIFEFRKKDEEARHDLCLGASVGWSEKTEKPKRYFLMTTRLVCLLMMKNTHRCARSSSFTSTTDSQPPVAVVRKQRETIR